MYFGSYLPAPVTFLFAYFALNALNSLIHI